VRSLVASRLIVFFEKPWGRAERHPWRHSNAGVMPDWHP
jgi:hypothetical protein